LVFHSSTIAIMHGPINIRLTQRVYIYPLYPEQLWSIDYITFNTLTYNIPQP